MGEMNLVNFLNEHDKGKDGHYTAQTLPGGASLEPIGNCMGNVFKVST